MRGYSVAIVGATGLVGRAMLTVLHERKFPVGALTLFASAASAGKHLHVNDRMLPIHELTASSFANIDIAIFSAGASVSHHFAPIAAAAGSVVIDNSSQWRLTPGVPLVVPEVNAHALKTLGGKLANRIIAVPNCSTIQMVMALKPLHDRFGLKRVVVSTYQSVTGAGHRGEEQLKSELTHHHVTHPVFHHPIAFNTIFHSFPYADGYSAEEYKMIHETRKILELDGLAITATCVRVPTLGGHGESINVELTKDFTIEAVRKTLAEFPGVVVQDNVSKDIYPMPVTAHGRDEVFVGRIRKDPSVPHGLNMWVVSDNLRKGAATDAVQIAESLAAMNLV